VETRPDTLEYARRLRKHMSRAEVVLWQAVRGKRLNGHKIRRQHPFGPYVLDFFCSAAALAIEVDGPVHGRDLQSATDFSRDQYLIKRGVRTLRVSTNEVLGDLDGVLAKIKAGVEVGGKSPTITFEPGAQSRLPASGGFAACLRPKGRRAPSLNR
jgi:very-short-patch-repair endonuclease